jgi:malate dehydrogenase (oxaloacetate-decarboxylating)(NADP+)
MALDDDALAYHAHPRPGKLAVVPTKPLATQRDLALAYSPGVAAACRAIAADPAESFRLTARGNLVAVITNGSAVLGLGNLGPLPAKPVMEGKANLFKKFADIDVFDLELDARTPDELVATVRALAPTFGGINLEDIKAPECFEVERRLQAALDIPVFHDDQHGTAIISAAALLNALELTDRALDGARVVFAGAGAAALACARHYVALGVPVEHITLCDKDGVIHAERTDLFPELAPFAHPSPHRTLAEAIVGADVFVGLSVAGVLTPEMLATMAPRPIVFALANPEPEIAPEVARAARPDAIVATGRSDHPNQVNNVLGFPFVFRGALDCQARAITEPMKVAATRALAALAREDVPERVLRAYGLEALTYGPDYLIPKPFDPRVLLWVAPAVAEAAAASGVARRPIADVEAYRERLLRLVERARGLIQPLVARTAAAPPRRIVFPEGDAPAVLRAAAILAEQRICRPVLLGDPEKVRARAASYGVDLSDVEIDGVGLSGDRFESLARRFWERRQRHGVTLESARAQLADRVVQGMVMLALGEVDGLVGGLGQPYKYTLRPAIRLLGTAPGATRVSGVYAMLAGDRRIFLGDCTVNLHPDAETLAAIALNTASVAEAFGETPRVAMLSWSDFGEGRRDPEVAKVRRALQLVRKARPDLAIDGEMQADTALDPAKVTARFPFTTLQGPANVLVFPALASGNIAYKLLLQLADAESVGPLLVGLGAPANVIPVHATANEIVHVATYTAFQALDAAARPRVS